MVALDAMEKSAAIEVWQAELNDFLGVVIKIFGEVEQVSAALSIGQEVADRLRGAPVSHLIPRLAESSEIAVYSRVEFNPLIQQDVVHLTRNTPVASDNVPALGFIETQGFTAVFAAIDTACKAAQVEVVGKEKLGGGYVTVVIQGDVAAVKAAVEAGQQSVEALGKLIAAHVVTRPSPSVMSLLPATG